MVSQWQGISRVMLLSIILVIGIAALWSPVKATVEDCPDEDKKFCGKSCFDFTNEFLHCGEVTGAFGCCNKGTKNDHDDMFDKDREQFDKSFASAQNTLTAVAIAWIVVPTVGGVCCCCIAAGVAYYIFAVRPRQAANANPGQVYTQPVGVLAPTSSSSAYSHNSGPYP